MCLMLMATNVAAFKAKKPRMSPRTLSALDATTLNNLSTFSAGKLFTIIFNKKNKVKDKKRKFLNCCHKKFGPKSVFKANYQHYWKTSSSR